MEKQKNKSQNEFWLNPGHLVLISLIIYLGVYLIFGWKGIIFFLLGQITLVMLLLYYDKHRQSKADK